MTMNKEGLYRRKALRNARPYVTGEDMGNVRFFCDGPPQEGGMILIDKYGYKWYMSEEFFSGNFEPGGIDQETIKKARGVDAELQRLRHKLEVLEALVYSQRTD